MVGITAGILTQIKAAAQNCGNTHCIHHHHACWVKKNANFIYECPDGAGKIINLIKVPPFHRLYDTVDIHMRHLGYMLRYDEVVCHSLDENQIPVSQHAQNVLRLKWIFKYKKQKSY